MNRALAMGVLVIGDELLNGKRVDRHLPHVIEVLAGRGGRAQSPVGGWMVRSLPATRAAMR